MGRIAVLLIVFIGISSQLIAQVHSQQEVGLRLLNVRDFNLIYKKQLPSAKYLRLRSAFTRFSFTEAITTFGLGGYIGLENRKAIFGKPHLLSGPELGTFYTYSGVSSGTISQIHLLSVSIGYMIGIQHQLSSNFNVSIEFVPTLSTSINIVTPNFNLGFDASFSTIGLIFTYIFGKG